MGNTLGRKKPAKIMKMNGEIIKFKTPIQARDITKDYPGHVLLESESVKHFGIRAKPLEVYQELSTKRLYFLVELPKAKEEKGYHPRRVRSGINMSAKDRLESLMLARRSASDLSIMKPTSMMVEEVKGGTKSDGMKLKLRLPKAEVEKLMMESKDEGEAAEKIVKLWMANNGNAAPNMANDHGSVHYREEFKARKKRVGFQLVNEGEIQLAVA